MGKRKKNGSYKWEDLEFHCCLALADVISTKVKKIDDGSLTSLTFGLANEKLY
ncbi:MAG: hypothetical protein HC854_15805 [Flavobacterium sp.]|nr:hypothetical protein [Flavobacterium sp.]